MTDIPTIKHVNSYQYQSGPPDAVTAHQLPLYATYIPDRRPAFKPHNTLGQAKNAINIRHYRNGGFRNDMGVYGLSGANYELILTVTRGSKREDYPMLMPPAPSAEQIRRQKDFELRAVQARIEALRAKADEMEASL